MKKKEQWKRIAAWTLTATLTLTAALSSVSMASEMPQNSEEEQGEVIQKWDFEDTLEELNGWEVSSDSYAYSGKVSATYDLETIASGALKLSVDYSKDSEVGWSEVKIQNSNVNLKGATALSCEFYYNPAFMTKGSFNMKAFANDAFDVYKAVTMEGETLENGYCKGSIVLQFDPATQEVGTLLIGIIGSMTDYKGDILLDNITLYKEKQSDIYVDVTEEVKDASKTEGLIYSDRVCLADENADASTSGLLAYLKAVGKSDYVLYGHQNDTHHKGGSTYKGSTNSDTKDITGSIAAICGIDTLSFTGAELPLPEGKMDSVDEAAALAVEAAEQGGIITLSAHMPNFAQVAEKPRMADGGYDYSGYSPGVTTGDVMARILPGGDLNEVYNGYLDLIAKYAHILAEENIPVLFRPLHENNGSWFWWGAAFCDEEGYKNVYRYTVEYLTDVKDVHNFLYIYSPNGPFESIDDYESRYPGDEYIDIIAFDMYHDNPEETDAWMDSFKETIQLVQSVADKHGKLATVSETGMRVQTSLEDGNNYGGIAPVGNKRLDWFSEVSQAVLESDMPYYMVWANFDAKVNFFAPYMVSQTRGHEMVNNFIQFYNEESSIFADGVTFYQDVPNVTIESQKTSGYIINPTSNSRMLEPSTLIAAVKHIDSSKKIQFVLYNKEKTIQIPIDAVPYTGDDPVLNAIGTIYTADVTAQQLEQLGSTTGTMDLVYDGTVLTTSAVLYNIEEIEKDPTIVDDFENYFGETSLLLNEWATNFGPGCSLKPQLSTEQKNSGDYGLAFHYRVSTEKVNEGWAGMTRSMEADWSEFNALQLWIQPDGKGQKLVIQLTSNGEDFEVFLNEFAATTEAKLVTIPFSALKGKSNGTFDPANITSAGIWCNTIPGEGTEGAWTIDSTMYFDNIKAVKTDVTDVTYEDPEGLKPTVNKNALKTMIDKVEGLNEKDYSAASWKVLQERLNVAKDVYADETATQTVVDQAYLDLVTAWKDLEVGLNTSAAEAVIKEAEAVLASPDLSEYRPSSVQAVRDSLAAVQSALANPETTQEQLNNTVTQLIDSLIQLKGIVNADALQRVIDVAEELLQEKDRYTTDTVKVLEEALANAKEVVANEDRTEQQVTDAYEALTDAIAGLVVRGDKSVLKPLIEKAEEILANTDAYTSSSLEGLAEVFASAKEVYDDVDAVQTEINTAAANLAVELSQVRILGDVNNDQKVDTADVAEVLKASAELIELSQADQEAADVKKEGIIDTADAALIEQYAAELITEF